ncbi:MAG: glycosyltransferase family 9 protein, partial [Gammaproteobacteria bacterium]
QILTVNLKALKTDKSAVLSEFRNIRGYARHDYDWVIDAQGLIKSALVARLLGKRVAGFDSASIREKAASWLYDVKVACAYHANTIDRNALVLSSPLGFTIGREQIIHKKPFLFAGAVDDRLDGLLLPDKKNIVFVIGSTWPSRNYPAAKYVKMAELLRQNCVVIWGGEQEKKTAEWMAEQSEFIRLAPKLDLNHLKALIAHADLVVGNDTGPTHMAWALNRPSITIFGPTPVSRVYQTDINKVVKSPSEVNPYKLNKQDFSIEEIDERDIIELAFALLSGRP